MGQLNLHDLSRRMRDIDCHAVDPHRRRRDRARPMSNNGDVEYDGDSFFFAFEQSRLVSDIREEPKVALSMQGSGACSASRRCSSPSRAKPS